VVVYGVREGRSPECYHPKAARDDAHGGTYDCEENAGGELGVAHQEESRDDPHERSRAQRDYDGWNLEL